MSQWKVLSFFRNKRFKPTSDLLFRNPDSVVDSSFTEIDSKIFYKEIGIDLVWISELACFALHPCTAVNVDDGERRKLLEVPSASTN